MLGKAFWEPKPVQLGIALPAGDTAGRAEAKPAPMATSKVGWGSG
jgi:hypothetical protein